MSEAWGPPRLGIEPSRDKRQKDAGDWSDWCRRRWGASPNKRVIVVRADDAKFQDILKVRSDNGLVNGLRYVLHGNTMKNIFEGSAKKT